MLHVMWGLWTGTGTGKLGCLVEKLLCCGVPAAGAAAAAGGSAAGGGWEPQVPHADYGWKKMALPILQQYQVSCARLLCCCRCFLRQ